MSKANVYLYEFYPFIPPIHIRKFKYENHANHITCVFRIFNSKWTFYTKMSFDFQIFKWKYCCFRVYSIFQHQKRIQQTYTSSNSKPISFAIILIARDPGVISISYKIGFADIFDNKFIGIQLKI